MTAVLIGAAGYWLRFLAPIGPEWRDRSGGAAYVIFWIFVLAWFGSTDKAVADRACDLTDHMRIGICSVVASSVA